MWSDPALKKEYLYEKYFKNSFYIFIFIICCVSKNNNEFYKKIDLFGEVFRESKKRVRR